MSVSALSWHDDRSPRELARWAIASAVVLGVHAGALIYLLAVHEPDIVGTNMDVVTVELAPIELDPGRCRAGSGAGSRDHGGVEPVARFAASAGKAAGASEARAAAG